jgi:hypothetical protein
LVPFNLLYIEQKIPGRQPQRSDNAHPSPKSDDHSPTIVITPASWQRLTSALRYLKMARSTVFLRLLLLLSPLLSLTVCAPIEEEWTHVSEGNILLPKDDAFYNAVAGYEKAKPGQILSYRRVPNPITLDNKNPVVPKSAWQFNYRTQNSVGEPEQTMVTILEPFNAKPDTLFVYHFFSVSSSV